MLNHSAPDCGLVSGDIIDFAVLGSLAERPRMPMDTIEFVRELCHPWLWPTGDVVRARLSRHLEAHLIEVTTTKQLHLTHTGQEAVRAYVAHGIATHSHELEVLCESLRLALADQLEPEARVHMYEALLHARDSCLANQLGRLSACRTLGKAAEASVQYGVAMAEAQRAAIGNLLQETRRSGSPPKTPA